MNDVFAITNAVPAIALLSYGFFHKGIVPGLCFGAVCNHRLIICIDFFFYEFKLYILMRFLSPGIGDHSIWDGLHVRSRWTGS